jgi:hypothetical protein
MGLYPNPLDLVNQNADSGYRLFAENKYILAIFQIKDIRF